MPSLTSLPPEVLNFHLVPFLDPGDVINLVLHFNLPVSTQVYNAAFDDHTSLPHYDKKVFLARLHAKLTVLTGFADGDVQDSAQVSAHCERIELEAEDFFRAHTPWTLDTGSLPIVHVDLSVDFAAVRDSEGNSKLFPMLGDTTLLEPETPKLRQQHVDDDFSANRERSWEWSSKSEGSSDVRQLSNAFFHLPFKHQKLMKTAGSRDLIALDESGMLWKWGGVPMYCTDRHQGIPFIPVDEESKEVIRGNVSSVYTDGGESAFFVEGRGLVVVTKTPNFGVKGGWRAGYPCYNDALSCYAAKTIAGTKTGVKSFFLCEGTVVLWHTNGKISGVYRDTHKDFAAVNSFGPFVQMDACLGSWIALCKDGRVIVVNKYSWPEPQPHVVQGLEKLTVVSVAVGEHHYLALTDTGDVYAWGYEEFFSGCMGFGRLEDAKRKENVVTDEEGFLVELPTKMDLPAKACAIFANMDTSAILLLGGVTGHWCDYSN